MAGTDTPVPPAAGFALHDELELLVKGGLTPEEALETATRNPARFLGRERDLGTVDRSKIADLVLLNANPLENIHNTTKISAVILHGQFLDRRVLDGMMKDAAAAGTSKTTART
jgi:imidazolonepropionase-like amidohydrolase